MSILTVAFEKAWLDACRERGVRVVRTLEKWLAGEPDFTLKSASSCELTVEMAPERRAVFQKALASQLAELGETYPWSHTVVSGDLDGVQIPWAGRGKAPAAAPQAPRPDADRQPAADAAPEAKPETIPEPAGPSAADVLEEICAAVPVKHSPALAAYVREVAAVIPALQRLGVAETLWHQHLLLAVDAGYGRTDFLRALARLYRAHGLLAQDPDEKAVREFILVEDGSNVQTDGYRVQWDTVLDAAREMRERNAKQGLRRVVLYVDISAWQAHLRVPEVKSRLRRLNALCGSFLVVFRVPFLEGHVLQDVADALNDILNVRTVAVPPAPLEDMADYARAALAKNGFDLAEGARGAFEQWLLREKSDDSFFGYKTVDKMVQRLIYEKALAAAGQAGPVRTVEAADLQRFARFVDPEGDPAEALGALVGMGAVARRLAEVVAQIRMQKELLAEGRKVDRPAIHMLFTGNPGTGKTTVARLVARLMKKEGILRKGHLVEVKARDLCGEYVGQTAPRTSAICRDAYGSVLFIDEAYSLFRGDGSDNDYGREALDTLVAEMENHRDDFCVVMAGYKDDMDAMLRGNAGLRSRIPYEIEFPNYSREDLVDIFFAMMDGAFACEDGLREAVRDFFADLPDEVLRSKEFSNARFVRNLYERTWGKAAYRRSLEGGATVRILRSDLRGAAQDREFQQLLEKGKGQDRHVVGFGA